MSSSVYLVVHVIAVAHVVTGTGTVLNVVLQLKLDIILVATSPAAAVSVPNRRQGRRAERGRGGRHFFRRCRRTMFLLGRGRPTQPFGHVENIKYFRGFAFYCLEGLQVPLSGTQSLIAYESCCCASPFNLAAKY